MSVCWKCVYSVIWTHRTLSWVPAGTAGQLERRVEGGDKEGKRWEAVRYTDNGIRLKHSGVGESPFLCIVPSNTAETPLPASSQHGPLQAGHLHQETCQSYVPNTSNCLQEGFQMVKMGITWAHITIYSCFFKPPFCSSALFSINRKLASYSHISSFND